MDKENEIVLRKRGRTSFDPKAFLAKMGEGKTISKYHKDQIVFSQGDVADAVFYIQQGKIKLTVVSERGQGGSRRPSRDPVTFLAKAVSIAIRSASQQRQQLKNVSLRALPKAGNDCCIASWQSQFSDLFMADLLSRNSRIEEDLIDQLFNSSEKRLARVLLLLANFGKEKRTRADCRAYLVEELLAEMIGTTRSRVSHFMNKFRKLGYIEYNGKLQIHNSLLNVVLYDKPQIRTHESPRP